MDMVFPVTALLVFVPQECWSFLWGREGLSAFLHPRPVSLYPERMKLHKAMSEFTHFMLCLAIMRKKKTSHYNLVLSVLHLGALGSRKVFTTFFIKVIVEPLFSLKGEKRRTMSFSVYLHENLAWRTAIDSVRPRTHCLCSLRQFKIGTCPNLWCGSWN